MKHELSEGMSRAAIIASYGYGTGANPPPAKTPVAPAKPEVEPEDILAAIKNAIELQERDPDGDTDPNDAKVLAALKDALKAQEADEAEETETPAKPAPPAVTAAAEHPELPVDEDGNVDGNHTCTTPDCGHMASAHANTPDGKNTGACSQCECVAMKIASHEGEGEEGEAGQSTEPSELGKEDMAITDGAVQDAIDLNPPPPAEGSDNMGAAFEGVLIIEGQPTGDGREIAAEALSWRDPPMPLMGLATETHDPTGMDLNDPAVLCGRIEWLKRAPGEGETQIVEFGGHFLANDDGSYFAELTEQMGRVGVSGDIAVEASEVTVEEVDEIGFPMDMAEVLTEGTIMGATICPYPAFHGAYIILADQDSEPTPIPQAVEEPAIVASGGQLIHYMSYEECEACAHPVEVIVASGGPARPPKSWFENPAFTEGDERLTEIYGRDGRREDRFACPITVTADGRIYGHLAPWGTCHTGFPGQCVTAPKSQSDYAHFMRSQYVLTAEGERVRVGTISADAPHAPLGFSAGAAMGHYDDTAFTIADVAAGEDDYGIWLAGAVRPGVSDEQIRKLTASSLSGDWRGIGGGLELVAALCVPQPGYPLAPVEGAHFEHGRLEAMVAAGVSVMARLHDVKPAPMDDVALLKLARPALARLARNDARERVRALG